MIVAVMSVLLAASDPAAAPASLPPDPPAKSPVQVARDNLDQAQQIYTQSCGDRAYGAYDDLCEQLSIQLRQYRIELDKLERAAADEAEKSAARPKL
jgi:hypothetical protein